MVARLDLETLGRCLAKDQVLKKGGGQGRKKTSVRFRLGAGENTPQLGKKFSSTSSCSRVPPG